MLLHCLWHLVCGAWYEVGMVCQALLKLVLLRINLVNFWSFVSEASTYDSFGLTGLCGPGTCSAPMLLWWPALREFPLIHVNTANNASLMWSFTSLTFCPRAPCWYTDILRLAGHCVSAVQRCVEVNITGGKSLANGSWKVVGKTFFPSPLDRQSWVAMAQSASWKMVLWGFEKSVVLTWYQGNLVNLLFLSLFLSSHFCFPGIIHPTQIVAHKQDLGSTLKKTQAETLGDLQFLLIQF